MTVFWGCGRRHPVNDLTTKMELEFVHEANSETLNAFFDGLTSTNRETQKQAVEMAWESVFKK